MSNQGRVGLANCHKLHCTKINQITSASKLNSVIFKQYGGEGVVRKFTSLFPGLGYAAGYKVWLCSVMDIVGES